MRSTRSSLGVVLAALVVCGSVAVAAAEVRIARSDSGLSVVASGAPLEEVLDALAAEEGFAVAMQRGLERRPVDVDLRDETLEQVLRRVLQRRNYAISFAETEAGLEVSRVEVLLPRSTVQASTVQTNAAVRAQLERSLATQQAARERNERRQAEQRVARQKAQRLRAQQAAQARRLAQQQRVAPEPVPLRRLLWGRSR